jgi:hypothetical protein
MLDVVATAASPDDRSVPSAPQPPDVALDVRAIETPGVARLLDEITAQLAEARLREALPGKAAGR